MAWYDNFIIIFLFISHQFLCLIFSDLTTRIKRIGELSLIHLSLVASNKPSWHNLIWRLVIRVRKPKKSSFRSVFLGGSWGPRDPPRRPSFEQTTYNIQVAKTPWQYLGLKSHSWKAHVFKICVFVKYFRQRLLSLVNMGLHAMIIRLSLLIHEGEQRWVASVTPPGYTPAMVTLGRGHWGLLHMCRNVGFLLFHCWVTIMTIFW